MSKKLHLSWKNSPPKIEHHARTKHEILEKYIREYVRVVSKKGFRRSNLKLTLVDGFSGGGVYDGDEGPYLGSPFILQNAVATARSEIIEHNSEFNLDVDFIFVEKDKDAYRYLTEDALPKFQHGDIPKDKTRVLYGDFLDKVDAIIDFVKNKRSRCVFILDPCGYTQLGNFFELFGKIFYALGDKAEIFFTFQVEWLVHYLKDGVQSRNTLKKIGFPDPIIKQLMDIDSDQSKGKGARLAMQQIIYDAVFSQESIKYYIPFCIKSELSHKSYVFLHLSNHVKARDVMLETIWDTTGHFIHEGRSGYNMLGYEVEDEDLSSSPYLFSEYNKEDSVKILAKQLIDQALITSTCKSAGMLYAKICNNIPIPEKEFYGVLKQMVQEKSICTYKDRTGSKALTRSIKKDTLIIKSLISF